MNSTVSGGLSNLSGDKSQVAAAAEAPRNTSRCLFGRPAAQKRFYELGDLQPHGSFRGMMGNYSIIA